MNPIFVRQTRRALSQLLEKTASLSWPEIAALDKRVGHLFQTLEYSLQIDELIDDSAELIQRLHHFIESHGYAAYWLPLVESAHKHPSLSLQQRLLLQNQLCNFYRCREEYDKAIATAHKALSQVISDDDLEISMRLNYNLALAYLEARQPDSAEFHVDQARQIFEQTNSTHPFLTVNLPNLRGLINLDKGNFTEAYALFMQAYNLARETDQTHFIGWTTGNAGIAAFRLKSWDLSLQHFEESRETSRSHKDERSMSNAALNIGAVYIELNEWNLAFKALEQANSAFIRRFGQTTQKAKILTNMGNAYLLSEDLDSAGRCLSEAVEKWEQTSETVELAYALGLLGLQLSMSGDKLNGFKSINEALALLKPFVEKGQSPATEYDARFRQNLLMIPKENANQAAEFAAA